MIKFSLQENPENIAKDVSTPNAETTVLIIGGSLVGLSAAMFLSWQNISVIVVERHTGSSPHPRAIGYPSRTMELFRAVGIDSQIPQTPANFRLRRVEVESLAGKWHEETLWTPQKQKSNDPKPQVEYSPCTGASIAQDKLEPILRSKATELGAQLRLGTELIDFYQNDQGVFATVRERVGGKEYQIKADYMIAADGNNSPVREKLNISRKGRGFMKTVRSVLFRAPLEEYLKSGVVQFEINQPDLKAFLTTYNDGRWVLMFTDDIERDEKTLKNDIMKAIGRDDILVEIITTGRWELSALVTDHFSAGRVFLAGDAAHTLPPTRGGFGANTGIQDVHNLVWKLAAVLSGKSAPLLLESYNAERHPIAWSRHQQIFARPDYAADAPKGTKETPIIDDAAMEFGQLYRSEIIIGAGEDLPEAMRPDQWLGQPGSRAPHLWIIKDDQKQSILDLFQHGWVMLSNNNEWCNALKLVSKNLNIEIQCFNIDHDFIEGKKNAIVEAYGIGNFGASLIRPDGYIAWRATGLPLDPVFTLSSVIKQVTAAV